MSDPNTTARAEAEVARAWLREPDYAEDFNLSDVIEWMNRRPVAELERILRPAPVEAITGGVVAVRAAVKSALITCHDKGYGVAMSANAEEAFVNALLVATLAAAPAAPVAIGADAGGDVVRDDGWQAEAEAQASALAERAGIDMMDDHGLFLADLEQTMIEFAQWTNKAALASPATSAATPEPALAGGVRRACFPRLTDAMIRAACKAHYGSVEIDGIAMTVRGRDWNFRQAFKRMWKGARSAALAAPSPSAGEMVEALTLPDEMTPSIRDALSLMLWHSGRLSRTYRELGFTIPTKAEDEQAFVLFRTLRFAITHGDEWREAAQQELRDLRAALSPTTAVKEG